MLIEVRKHHILTQLSIDITNQTELVNQMKDTLDAKLLTESDDEVWEFIIFYKKQLERLEDLKTRFAQETRK